MEVWFNRTGKIVTINSVNIYPRAWVYIPKIAPIVHMLARRRGLVQDWIVGTPTISCNQYIGRVTEIRQRMKDNYMTPFDQIQIPTALLELPYDDG